ncbi:MAG: hypothetical protein J7M40_18155 [Planctomycetes bacterium]|nr:hypothetical protein [Planctomycetota bacterium]
MSQELYDSIPEQMEIRVVTFDAKTENQTEPLNVVTTLLDHLRCKSPDMVRREFWTILLAYNMVRLVCAQAAFVHNKLPRRMSFTIACNTLLSQWLMPPDESIRQTLGKHNLFQIACNEVAAYLCRSDGSLEEIPNRRSAENGC